MALTYAQDMIMLLTGYAQGERYAQIMHKSPNKEFIMLLYFYANISLFHDEFFITRRIYHAKRNLSWK